MTGRHLIVNADDLGLSAGVDAGIAEAHERGIVTSASLMVRQPHAEAGARWAAGRPRLSLGLHVDLCEWIYRDEQWVLRYERVPVADASAVDAEVHAQIETFIRLVGRPPTHLDSHQHVHRHDPVGAAVRAAGARLGVPVRDQSGVRYAGDFYGQSGTGYPVPECISVTALAALLAGLPEGWTEIGCHPGFAEDVDDTYREERRVEVSTLCDPAIRSCVEEHGVTLCSYADVPAHLLMGETPVVERTVS